MLQDSTLTTLPNQPKLAREGLLVQNTKTRLKTEYPQVVLSANITRCYQTALVLQQAGYLKRYIRAAGFRVTEAWWPRFLPSYWHKKLQGRDISKIKSDRVRIIWAPELLIRVLRSAGVISVERSYWLHDHLYDRLAQRWVEPSDVFHFVNPVGLYSARKARTQGSLVICDVRTVHPDAERQLLAEEYQHLGERYDVPGRLLDSKIKAEFAIADYLIVPSTYVKQTFIQAGFESDKIFVVPLGVDIQQFRLIEENAYSSSPSELPNEENVFRVIYAGRIVPGKGVHYLIEAFDSLAISNSELTLLGRVDSTMRPLIDAAARRNPRIRTLGDVPKLDLFRYYNAGSVFVLPSLVDSWALVVLEAMACGLPVIITENTGSREAVREGVDGFIVPIRSAAALQEKLLHLYRHPELRQGMGQAARQRVQDFTWDQYGENLLHAYTDILQREKVC
jgi:starch synthase